MMDQTPPSTRTTVGHSILAKLLHGCVSIVAVILAAGVVFFGFCVLPFSTSLRHTRRWIVRPHAS